MTEQVITTVEIGTHSLKVCMGRPKEDGTIDIIGFQETSLLGRVVKGEVTDVEWVSERLGQAFNAVESQARENIGPVYLAITGRHVHSMNVQASVPVTSPDRVITENEIIRATRNARDHEPPVGQYEIQSIQRAFIIDSDRRVNQPEGMVGNTLTAEIHLVYGDFNRIETQCELLKSTLGERANDIAFSGIADFYAFSPMLGEQQGGTLVIDIGAGVTEYVLFHNFGCVHSGQLAIGCEHIANDLAIILDLPTMSKARKLLQEEGIALRMSEYEKPFIEVEVGLGKPKREIETNLIAHIIEDRLDELLSIIREDLVEKGVSGYVSSPILLCGGGAQIKGLGELCQRVFNVPAIVGIPAKVSGDEKVVHCPRFVTPIGLLRLGLQIGAVAEQTPSLRRMFRQEFSRIFQLLRHAFKI